MMKSILILAAICSTVAAQDRSIEALRREIAQGYHRVDPHTQTQARSGDQDAQARLRYQQAQSQTTGDYNTGRTDAAQAEAARTRATVAYQAELLRNMERSRIEALRRQELEIQRLREEIARRPLKVLTPLPTR
jgi:hypothetical protein